MVRKTSAQWNVNVTAKKDLKRKRLVVEDDIVDETINVEDEEEGSHSNSLTDGDAAHGQSSRVSLIYSAPEFESRYYDLKMATRTVLFSKPRNDSILDKCSLTALLEKLKISSLVVIPRFCYLTYVNKFYANLHKDKFDNYILIVKGRRLV